MPSSECFCFTHLTDPHLTSLDNVRVAQILNKRLLGYLSWRRRRQHIHQLSVLNTLMNHMQTLKPDHVVISGDLTHIGLPQEFDQVADWLPTIGTAQQVTLVPGNHELYVNSKWQDSFAKWQNYLGSDQTEPGQFRIEYPTLRIRKHVAFIGLNSAYASLPFLATGRLGTHQLDRLQKILIDTGQQGLFRVVIVHHPPLPGLTRWRKRLTDAANLQQIIFEHGAELVLYGHTHNTTYREIKGKDGVVIPIVSLSSASSVSDQEERKACFAEFKVKRLGNGQWQIQNKLHQYQPGQHCILEKALDIRFAHH
ncbi:MAG: metallophosphoesterase [Gammaproteobacteria bacterium]|nr:metallophosphoesterase [Gammaproteobacteria bacterium]